MFGSRKGNGNSSDTDASENLETNQSKPKKRFWPFGRKKQPTAEAEPAHQAAEVTEDKNTSQAAKEVDDKASPVETQTLQTEEVTAQPSFSSQVDAVVTTSEEPPKTSPETLQVDIAAEVIPQEEPVKSEVLQADRQSITTPEPDSIEQNTPVAAQAEEQSKKGFLARMKRGLTKTRKGFVQGVTTLFIGKKEIDDDLLEELETQLLVSDVGIEATSAIINGLTERIKYKELDDADALLAALKTELRKLLDPADEPLVIDQQRTPFVILVVGVNGVGKTTTIGKLAKKLQLEGKKVMLAAGDTFRAAAVEQLQVWGDRNEIPVIAQHTGADSASVIYDAIEAARARNIDVLIADTAGRLHNKSNLMDELTKVKRVMAKLDASAPHEVLLVVDAGTGQNALNQAHDFNAAVALTGMALTKLDGTAKGGIVFAMAKQMKLPIRFLGVGEQIDDLRPFKADEFIEVLFSDENK
ncbi:signal recognition particle-docking protein FtsY [Zooshikella harenae]|uniref:Signal recognition particle receptor FtsY n=1 Tax=Zooshikella harenae TaxID=2827238 RepID=A0ABS5ZGW3_9GAMM|nr:signal recognition particle-docking protein FtsY [Zooshikella harenae]MBU2713215.1 signal recognition particle-docking protein FtsY [Zooshikella harenae]